MDFDYRYTANYGTLANPAYAVEPGALTLRATNNINVNASISDGFFQFANYLDSTYVTQVQSYVSSTPNSPRRSMDGSFYLLNYWAAAPSAPYKAAANEKSPSSPDLSAADVFPHTLNVCTVDCTAPNVRAFTTPSSWSYRMTAGAATESANPRARQSLAAVQSVGGDVVLNSHATYQQRHGISGTSVGLVNLPTMLRTGTGDVTIAAARDVILKDTAAPGVIYAAGVNAARLADPGYVLTGGNVVAQNTEGFLEPRVLAYGYDSSLSVWSLYGPPTAAAFPEQGGDVEVVAQRDIQGFRDVAAANGMPANAYYTPWLLANAGISPSATASTLGAGVFAPSGTAIASQSAWWIQYGSFREGILSAGGNVTVEAGRDLKDVSVSLPSTGRVSGGLASLGAGVVSTPVTHVYGGGNMTVRAGRNLIGGSFYEGSGHASILVRGSVGQNGTLRVRPSQGVTTLPNYPLLAVDLGQISLVAGGTIRIGGVINPAELHQQSARAANPGDIASSPNVPILMDTYGPDSKVSLVAIAGGLNIALPQTAGTTSWTTTGRVYPASLEAIALNGDITTTGLVSPAFGSAVPGIVLSGSEHGTFKLLAQGSIDLTGGYIISLNAAPSFSAGPSLLDAAFDPYRPNNGMVGAFSTPVLAHEDDHDSNVARIYAVSGDIKAVGTVTSSITTQNNIPTAATTTDIVRIEINRPAKIYAGRDIIDLNLIVQNIDAADVSTVVAGRDIVYSYPGAAAIPTSPVSPTVLGGPGLQVAGPGFFVVEAGRDIGPFLPATRDTTQYTRDQEGIASVGNTSLWPVGNRYVRQGSIGTYNTNLLGPASAVTKKRNQLLPSAGADIIVMFGVANGADYDAVIRTYIDPTRASLVTHNYIRELAEFLNRIGLGDLDEAAAWAKFQTLSADLQHVFVDQVFFAELKAVGVAQQESSGNFQRGYEMVNAMFPARLGYTANGLGGGAGGASQLVKTGDLEMNHATIQTRLGGDILIFGPGGSIRVGSLAVEPNRLLKPNDIGILTLSGGGISTFTDGSVLVNSSRIMTQQGGDILMWSSNGDLDAGRGSRTTLSLPPLQAVFDSDDYQSVDLGGLVSGAGIAVVKTSRRARASNAYLLAPRGVIDAGDAGIRVSGDLVLAGVRIVNADNIKVGGVTTGTPTVTAPNVGALTAASSTAGSATRGAETTPGGTRGADKASVFIIEVIGYGGGDDGDDQTKPSPGPAQSSAPDGAQPSATPQ